MKDLELKKLENEIDLQELDKKLKEKELNKNSFFEPQKVTILVALIGLIGIAISNLLQRNNQILIEQKKFQYSVYQKALESNNQKMAADILDFYIKAGLIPGEKDKYKKLLKQGDKLPVYNNLQRRNDSLKVESQKLDSIIKSKWGRIKQ